MNIINYLISPYSNSFYICLFANNIYDGAIYMFC